MCRVGTITESVNQALNSQEKDHCRKLIVTQISPVRTELYQISSKRYITIMNLI